MQRTAVDFVVAVADMLNMNLVAEAAVAVASTVGMCCSFW